LYLLL
jgi:hypothetical protein